MQEVVFETILKFSSLSKRKPKWPVIFAARTQKSEAKILKAMFPTTNLDDDRNFMKNFPHANIFDFEISDEKM